MARFEKERNIIKFYVSGDDRHYDFDINKGVLYGLKGSPLKRNPAGFIEYMSYIHNDSNVLQYMYWLKQYCGRQYADLSRFVNYIQICDRLDSIGYKVADYWCFPRENQLKFIGDNFKAFSKAYRENPELSISEFIDTYRTDMWLKTNGITVDDYFTRDMANHLASTVADWDKKKIGCTIFYLKRGLVEIFGNYNNALNRLADYFNYCDRLEIEYVRGDFVREFANAKRNYEFRKTELDNNAIYEHQMQHIEALEFSYGDYEVVVPMTSQEFIDEGNAQSNCVARLYLPKVIKGTTNIVFVRRKSDLEKSYITCEVLNGEIEQYLARFNNRVYDESAVEFKRMYQEHLNEKWGN